MQLGDPGGHTQTSLFPQHDDGQSASAYFDLFYGYRNRTSAMTMDEVAGEVQKFRDAARRVRMIGCDGVEVTASKGYIIHQFLNRQRIGAAIDTRARNGSAFSCCEIVQAVREEVGRHLFGVRLSQDFNYLPWWNVRLPPVWPLRRWWMGNTPEKRRLRHRAEEAGHRFPTHRQRLRIHQSKVADEGFPSTGSRCSPTRDEAPRYEARVRTVR
jgi:hypothetical protein